MPTMELKGAKVVQRLMVKLGPDVAQAAGSIGLFAAAKHMSRALSHASPISTGKTGKNAAENPSGTLRREWRPKRLPQNYKRDAVAYAVGLRERYYYELLEFEGVAPGQRSRAGSKRQKAAKRRGRYHPFAEKAMMRAKSRAFSLIVESSRRELIKAAKVINNISKGDK